MAIIKQNPSSDLPEVQNHLTNLPATDKNPEAATNVGEEMDVDKNETFLIKGSFLISSSSSSSSNGDSEATLPAYPSDSGFTIKPIEDAAVTGEETSLSKKRKATAGSSNAPHGREKRRMPKEDEVTILRGMTEFMSVHRVKPEGGELHKFLKKHIKLSFELSTPQLSDKIYRLRKRYEANVKFFGENVNPVFKQPHAQSAFDLSKKIWGPEAEAILRKPQNSKPKQALVSPKQKIKSKKGKEIESQPSFGVEKGKAKATELGLDEGAAGKLGSNSTRKLVLNPSELNSEKDESFRDVKKLITERMRSHGNEIPELKEKWVILQEEEIKLKIIKLEFEKKMHEFALDLLRSSSARK